MKINTDRKFIDTTAKHILSITAIGHSFSTLALPVRFGKSMWHVKA